MQSDELRQINYLLAETDAAYHEAAVAFGLSDSTLRILYALYCADGKCLLGDITKLSGLTKQTVHSSLHKLERQGLLTVERFDGRKKTVSLTARGGDLAARTVARLVTVENAVLAGWSADERATYIALARKYLDGFRDGLRHMK